MPDRDARAGIIQTREVVSGTCTDIGVSVAAENVGSSRMVEGIDSNATAEEWEEEERGEGGGEGEGEGESTLVPECHPTMMTSWVRIEE